MTLPNISGLSLIEDFISEEEESQILSHIPKSSKSDKKAKTVGRNAVRRYGAEVYKTGVISKNIPQHLLHYAKKLVEFNLLSQVPDHITLNEYQQGGAISPHIDNQESGEVITIISLLSDAEMVLSIKGENQTIHLPRRSLLQLKDDARWKWKHSIKPVKSLRYSLVFRDSKLNLNGSST